MLVGGTGVEPGRRLPKRHLASREIRETTRFPVRVRQRTYSSVDTFESVRRCRPRGGDAGGRSPSPRGPFIANAPPRSVCALTRDAAEIIFF
jgi:hypothetical protein